MMLTLHKRFKNKWLRKLCKKIQCKFADGSKLFSQYHVAILDRRAAIKFITETREIVTALYGRNTVREFIINFRTRFGTTRPDKLFRDFQKYVASKTVKHSSDLAIACNLLRYISLTHEQQVRVVDFLVDRLGDKLPALVAKLPNDQLTMKKLLIVEKVKQLGTYTQ